MERLRVIPGGRAEFARNGARVSARISNPLEEGEKPTGTARHEIKHAKVAQETGVSVLDATIVPGPGYNGLTRLAGESGPARVGPHVTGESGGLYDMFMEELSGADVQADTVIAKGIIYNNEDGINYAASLLQRKKTMTGGQIQEAFRRFDEGEKVVVEFKTPDGITSETKAPPDAKIIPLFGRRLTDAPQDETDETTLSEGVEVEISQAA